MPDPHEIIFDRNNIHGWLPVIRAYGISLKPVEPRHVPSLFASLDNDVTEYLSFPTPAKDTDTLAWVESNIEPMRAKKTVPFAICNKSGDAVGVTTLIDLRLDSRTAEIGSWLAKAYWGSGYNLASKRMLLGFAFDALNLERVRITTFAENERSTAAVKKLGLHYEGLVRRDVFVKGKHCDRHYFSVLDGEWPDVRNHIEAQLMSRLPLPG